MNFGGTGGSADAVTAGTAAQQNDDISGIGGFSLHRASGSRAHHSADLHALRHIVGMINLFHIAGSQTDLVSVGAVAVGSFPHQLLLGQLTFHGILHRHGGICRSCHTHGLVYIGTAGQGIADGSSQTGGGASEGLNLCGMVVGLIFEVDQPLLFLSIHIHRNHDGAGVDFFRLLLIRQLSFRFQLLHGQQGQIHQTDEFVVSSFI